MFRKRIAAALTAVAIASANASAFAETDATVNAAIAKGSAAIAERVKATRLRRALETLASAPKADRPAASRAGALRGAYQDVLPSVVVNGTTLSDAASMLVRDGAVYARVTDLAQWHLKFDQAQSVAIGGALYVPLGAAGLTAITFDAATQSLSAAATPDRFVSDDQVAYASGSSVTAAAAVRQGAPRALPALTETYSFVADGGSGGTSGASAELSTVWNVGPGEFLTGFADSVGSSQSGLPGGNFQRLDTAYVIDDAKHLRRLRIGDSVTVPDAAGDPVEFAGVQYGSGFDLDPRFVTFPTPTLHGTAYVPSVAQVYANGALQYSQPVNPGNFTLRNVPLDGQGVASVVVRDLAGATHVISEPFVASRNLLRAGVSDFSLSAGASHIADGYSTNRYGPVVATVGDRWGVRDGFTLASHVESGAGTTEASLEGFGAIPIVGVVGLGAAQSLGHGTALIGDYSTERGPLGLSGDIVSRSPGFRLVGDRLELDSDPLIGTSYDLSASLRIARQTSLRATLSGQDQQLSGHTTLRIVSLDRSIRGALFSVGYESIVVDQSASKNVTFNYAFPLGATAEVSAQNEFSNSAEQNLEYDRDTRQGRTGSEVDALVDQSGTTLPFASVNVLRPLSFGDVSYGITGGAYGATLQGGATGSVVLAGGRTVVTPGLGDSFILVRTGYPNVVILVNGFSVGRTDRRGDLITSSVSPLEDNVVSIDGNDLPAGAAVPPNQHVRPPRHGSALVNFARSSSGAVTIHLVRSDGGPIPPGSTIAGIGGPWPVGDGGLAFLMSVKPGALRLDVDLGFDHACRATVQIPADAATLPDLGTVTCVMDAVASAATGGGGGLKGAQLR